MVFVMSDLIRGAYQSAVAGATAGRALAYQRLREALRQLIDSGRLPPGSGLPSERELAEQLALSRVTVRRSLVGLVEDGLLVQRQGAGTFVAERLLKSISKLSSFTDDLRARGLRPRAVILERELGEVTPIEAMALNLSPGAGVSRITRLRYAGDEPLAIERSAVPASVLPSPDLLEDSLYELLDRLGGRPKRALQRVRAIGFNAEQAQLLRLPMGSPGLLVERRGFHADGRVIEFSRSYYRGDSYDFLAELHSD